VLLSVDDNSTTPVEPLPRLPPIPLLLLLTVVVLAVVLPCSFLGGVSAMAVSVAKSASVSSVDPSADDDDAESAVFRAAAAT
jgi:hypothetical protein